MTATPRSARQVLVVLPAYEEAENLPPLFAGLARLAAELDGSLGILLVDDGSTDGTAEVAERAGAGLDLEILRNPSNAGLGVTFARGMRAAAERAAPDDVIVCMDADDSHLPEQIPALVTTLDFGYDVAVVSRFRPGAKVAGVPWRRRGLALGMSLLFRAIHPVPGVRDYSTGFRAYRASTIQAAIAAEGEDLFDTAGFGCMVSLLLRLHARGARCAEIPIVLRYDRKRGDSKMRVLPTVAHTLAVLARARLAPTRPRSPATSVVPEGREEGPDDWKATG